MKMYHLLVQPRKRLPPFRGAVNTPLQNSTSCLPISDCRQLLPKEKNPEPLEALPGLKQAFSKSIVRKTGL